MDIKKKTQEELESRIENLENFIAKKGLGSKYLQRIQKTQRNINLLLVAGGITTLLGLSAWLIFSGSDEAEDDES